MELFNSEQVATFLRNKRVVVIGDSIQRSIYKDLIRLLVPDSTSVYLTNQHLKTKGELEFLGDKLLQGGQLEQMNNGINYREVRQYNNGSTVVRFYFVTRCYSDYVKSILHGIKCMRPHAIIMNSCLWDLHRYGLYGPLQYVDNMHKLMIGLRQVIPSDAVFIWNATLPLDSKCKGGFLLPYFDNIPAQEIIEANFIAADIVRSYGFLFLDLHSVFVHRLELRENDGIHWNALANRIITHNVLILLSYSWNIPIPNPRIQDPRVHNPHSEFSSSLSTLANSIGVLPQMRSDRRYLTFIPLIHDSPYGNPLFKIANKPLTYHPFSGWRSSINDPMNSLFLKGLENSAQFKESLPKETFSFTGYRPSFSADNLTLRRVSHTPPTSPLDNLFTRHPPIRPVPPDRHLFRTPTSIPEVAPRQADSLHQEHLLYHNSALSLLFPSVLNQHYSSMLSRPHF